MVETDTGEMVTHRLEHENGEARAFKVSAGQGSEGKVASGTVLGIPGVCGADDIGDRQYGGVRDRVGRAARQDAHSVKRDTETSRTRFSLSWFLSAPRRCASDPGGPGSSPAPPPTPASPRSSVVPPPAVPIRRARLQGKAPGIDTLGVRVYLGLLRETKMENST